MPRPPTRGQKRWSARLRTAGALLLLAGTVGLLDRLLWRGDPVLGPSPFALPLALLALVAGAVLFPLGQTWK